MHKNSLSNSLVGFKEINFVTVSEDQSMKVFSMSTNSNPHLIFSDKKHFLASTCVSWKDMLVSNKRMEIIGSSGDDRKIHLYLVNNDDNYFDKESNVVSYLGALCSQSLLPRWHTITYFSLEENGNKVACATQNGYLIIWELAFDNNEQLLNHPIYYKKVSGGGIEGLSWRNKKIVLTGSDLSLSIIDFSN